MAGPGAVPAVLRTAVAGVAFFGLCGLAPARAGLPEALRPYAAVLVLPLGAACSTLSLTVLGLLHVPFGVSLPVVGAAFARGRGIPCRTSQPGWPSSRDAISWP